jgi:hypothetical protein
MCDDSGIWCWFCPVCEIMTLLDKAEGGECCCVPRRPDCPLPAPVSANCGTNR